MTSAEGRIVGVILMMNDEAEPAAAGGDGEIMPRPIEAPCPGSDVES